MTKPSDTLFDGTPENWPAFEHHLLTEAKKPNHKLEPRHNQLPAQRELRTI
jgi:hypothetical protein